MSIYVWVCPESICVLHCIRLPTVAHIYFKYTQVHACMYTHTHTQRWLSKVKNTYFTLICSFSFSLTCTHIHIHALSVATKWRAPHTQEKTYYCVFSKNSLFCSLHLK